MPTKRSRFTVAAFALLIVGCAHTGNVLERAAFELDCPKDRIEVVEDEGYVARGCNREARYACRSQDWMQSRCRAVARPEPTDGPSARNSSKAARARAVQDLACAEDQLSVIYLEEHVRGVQGCGKRIVYRCDRSFFSYSCEAESAVLPY